VLTRLRSQWRSISPETRRQSVTLSVTVGVYGVAFGASSMASGFGLARTVFLSLVMFTGASQFALVGAVASGSSALSAVVATVLLSTRNALYAMQVAPWLNATRWRRVVGVQVTIDESTNLGLSKEKDGVAEMRAGFWLTGLGVYLCWNLGTLIGALSASALTTPAAVGLDAAVPCAFVALLWPRLTNRRAVVLALAAVLWALIGALIFPAGLAIPSAAVIVLIGDRWLP
jgi:4-azaleucine resistance transporter AzlC